MLTDGEAVLLAGFEQVGGCQVINSVVILGCSSFGNSPINTYFKVEYINKMIALSVKT